MRKGVYVGDSSQTVKKHKLTNMNEHLDNKLEKR